jgi:HEAT repeat protein
MALYWALWMTSCAFGDDPRLGELSALLDSGSVTEKVTAARSLATFRSSEARNALMQALDDPEPSVRQEAALSLGVFTGKRVVLRLVALLDSESDPMVKAVVAEALGQMKSRRATHPLVEVLWDPSVDVRLAASKALGQIADPGATLALAERLQDSSAAVRRTAAASMARIGDHRAIRPLIECLKDEDDKVRSVALEGLRALTLEDFGQNHDAWIEWFKREYKYEAIRFEEE